MNKYSEDIFLILQVSTEEGKALATQLGCPFFETSAALRHFVDDAFHALVREIRRLERQRQVGYSLEYIGHKQVLFFSSYAGFPFFL